MRIKLLIIFLSLGFVLSPLSSVFAQVAIDGDENTSREEAEGKEVWRKLQAKGLDCEDLSEDDFGTLGEYFMGQMMSNSHEAMNAMMEQRIGEEGEKQMHIAMGKRMSGCEPNAPMPQDMHALSGVEGMDNGMMSMMMGAGMMGGGGNFMMGNFGFGWIFMILFWGLAILGIVALIKWLVIQSGGKTKEKSALDILKKRYAKGEINKKEFEEKKKDLT